MKNRKSILNICTSILVLAGASLFCFQTVVAQIVLTRNSFDSFLNSEFSNTSSVSLDAENIIPLLDIKGANQTWDFTTLTFETTISGFGTIETFTSAEGTPGEGDEHFEQATHVSRSVFSVQGTIGEDEVEMEFINYEYNIINDDEYVSLGSVAMSDSNPLEVNITIFSRPGDVLYKFPATFESTWDYEFEEELISDMFDSSWELSVDVVIDGWGELVTPYGTFNVLRITRTKAMNFGFFTIESLEVEFVNEDGLPMASLGIEKVPFSEEYDEETAEANMNVISTDTNNPRENAPDLPDQVTLHQNYPNPFNPATQITYDLAEAAMVSLDIYSITGIKVMPLLDNHYRQAGRHAVSVDASGLASGVYIYQLRAGNEVLTRKMTLIK